MIIAVGFKVNSERAVQFRKWVNQIAKDYTIKGWVMDDERLKRGTYLTEKYFDEQLERIREIRASERKFYQKITDLYATAIDYDKNSATTRRFYATVQNKMHYAVHGHTAAELIVERADHTREHMGLTTWADAPEGKIKKSDVTVAKNYLSQDEMKQLNRMVTAYLDFAENMTLSLFVISDSNKKEPGTDTILTLRPVHPWDRMNEEEFMQCIKGIVPNPAVQIEIETNKGSELYSSDYFDDLDLKPLLDYSWNNIKNIRKIDIDLTCEAYGFKGKGCIGILIKNGLPAEEIEILSKDVEIDGEIYTLSSNIKYKTNCITETSTSISVDEDGEIDTNTSWSERFKSKASLSIHGIEVPYNLFPDYSNGMSKAALKIPFPFSFRLDIGVNSDLNLNSARDQIIYDEKWLTFEENLYRIICRRLKDTLSSSDWKILNEIIQKNNTDTFSRVANSFE